MQYTSNNNKVSNSTTFTADNDTYNSLLFAGNNTEFTGTLYLHPAITNLKFTSKKSVITNISVPNVEINTGKDRDVNPFVKSRNMKIICLYLPDNKDFGRLNINGNVTVDLINNCKKPTYLSFTEINKSSMYSMAVHDKIDLIINKYNDNYYSKCKCKCHKNNFKLLRDININCEEYKENTANKFTTLSCTATAKWQDGESVFEYILKCSNCNNKQIKTKASLNHGIEHYTKYGKYFLTSEEIFKQLSQQSCSKCKYNFNKNKTSINTTSWLYLDNNCNIYVPSKDEQYAHTVNLLCAACQTPAIYFIFNETHDNIKDKLININNNCCNNISCKAKVLYDEKYINNQLSLIKDTLNDDDNCKYNFIKTKLDEINSTYLSGAYILSEPEINNITLAIGCMNKDQINGFVDTIDILFEGHYITAQQLSTFMKEIANIDNFKKIEAFMNGIANLQQDDENDQMFCFMIYLISKNTEAFMDVIKEMDKDKIETFMNGVSTLKQNHKDDNQMSNFMFFLMEDNTEAFMNVIKEMDKDKIETFMNGIAKLQQDNKNTQMYYFMCCLMNNKTTEFMEGISKMDKDKIEAFIGGIAQLEQPYYNTNQLSVFMDKLMNADTNKITAFMTVIKEMDKKQIEAFMNGVSKLKQKSSNKQMEYFMEKLMSAGEYNITTFMKGIKEMDKDKITAFMDGVSKLEKNNSNYQMEYFMYYIMNCNTEAFMTGIKEMDKDKITAFMNGIAELTQDDDNYKMQYFMEKLMSAGEYNITTFMKGIKEMDKDKITAFMDGVSKLEKNNSNYQMEYFMDKLMKADTNKITAFMTVIKEMDKDKIEAFMNGIAGLTYSQIDCFMVGICGDDVDVAKTKTFMTKIKGMVVSDIQTFMENAKQSDTTQQMNDLIDSLINPSE